MDNHLTTISYEPIKMKQMAFVMLKPTECFRYKKVLYIKTREFNNSGTVVNAIQLTPGENCGLCMKFDPGLVVEPKRISISVDEILEDE